MITLDEAGYDRAYCPDLHGVHGALRERRLHPGLGEDVVASARQGHGFRGVLLPRGVVAPVDLVVCTGERELCVEVEPAALTQRRPLLVVVRALRRPGQHDLNVVHRTGGVVQADVSRHLGQAPGVRAGAVAVLGQLRHAEVVVHAMVVLGRGLARCFHGRVGGEERREGHSCNEEALRCTHPPNFWIERGGANSFFGRLQGLKSVSSVLILPPSLRSKLM
jgi:hypothetical protein